MRRNEKAPGQGAPGLFDKDASEFSTYSMSSTYTAGQLVAHPKFGRGYVKEALDATKVAIVFREGARTLIQGKAL